MVRNSFPLCVQKARLFEDIARLSERISPCNERLLWRSGDLGKNAMARAAAKRSEDRHSFSIANEGGTGVNQHRRSVANRKGLHEEACAIAGRGSRQEG